MSNNKLVQVVIENAHDRKPQAVDLGSAGCTSHTLWTRDLSHWPQMPDLGTMWLCEIMGTTAPSKARGEVQLSPQKQLFWTITWAVQNDCRQMAIEGKCYPQVRCHRNVDTLVQERLVELPQKK